jgi:hypothetical protein
MRALGAALKPRGARRFFLAHAQSSIGSGIALVGLPLLAYERFHTPWALTVVLLCELLPAVLLGPVLSAWPTGSRGARASSRPTCCGSARSRRSRSFPRSA